MWCLKFVRQRFWRYNIFKKVSFYEFSDTLNVMPQLWIQDCNQQEVLLSEPPPGIEPRTPLSEHPRHTIHKATVYDLKSRKFSSWCVSFLEGIFENMLYMRVFSFIMAQHVDRMAHSQRILYLVFLVSGRGLACKQNFHWLWPKFRPFITRPWWIGRLAIKRGSFVFNVHEHCV